MTVGEKNPNKPNKTILLVGETGAGKSTLINVLLNYAMGVKWEDEVWFQIIEEEKKSQTESQTSDVIVYEIFGFEGKTLPYSLTIIDTPGFGDTKGIENDDNINQRLLDLFWSEDGVHELHAVGLVMKASDNRLNDRLKYVFNSVMSLFGKNMEKNIVALITHSDGRRPKNALQALEVINIKYALNKKNQPVHFLFNNCQHEDRREETEYLRGTYEMSERGIREFTAFLEESEPQKLGDTVNVLTERIRLTACIQNLQERIQLTELKQTEIRQIQEALKKHEEEMKKNEMFTVEVKEIYKNKEPFNSQMRGEVFDEEALCCTVCEETCHYPCKTQLGPEQYEVMKRGHCTVCTNKCPASKHVNEKWKYVTKTRRVKKTLDDVKEKYVRNKSESENKLGLLEHLQKEMNQLTAEKSQLLDESYQHVVNLQQIALKADSVSIIVHLDFLIEKMKEKRDTEKVQKLEEMRSRVDEGTRSALQYFCNKLTAPKKKVQEALKIRNFSLNDISRSVRNCLVSPAIHQLKPNKQKRGTLTRVTVGEKNPKKKNKTILLVGETGAGKSTLINALINYTMGEKREDKVCFHIAEEERRSQSESQTSDVIVYEIFGFEDKTLPYSLTIIDTPGYGDTRETGHGDIISQRLLDLFQLEDGVHEVHAIDVVMIALHNPGNDQMMSIFDSVMSLFGKDMENNIVALITHSDERRHEKAVHALEVAKIKCARSKKDHPVQFLFNIWQHQDQTEETDGMREFTAFLEKTEPQNLEKTVEVLNERIRLTACIRNLQDRIQLTELKQTEIRQIQEALKKHEEEMEKHKKEMKELEEEMTTDYSCKTQLEPEQCEVISGGHHTVCTNKCPPSDHVNKKSRCLTKTRNVQKTLENLKKKCDQNKSENEKKCSHLENLQKEMNQLTVEKPQLLDESYQHVVRLEQIALKASASTAVHLDFLIEKMKERGDTEKVQNLEEMKSTMNLETTEPQ